MNPSLIVMLTHNDRTVKDAIEVFESAKNSKAELWGFKEVGLPIDKMKDLVSRMKKAGKTTFIEVVEYTEEECLAGAKIGIESGFDVLMGTMYFDSVRDIAKEAGMKYMPFVGQIHDRPSILEGSIEEMVKEAKSLIEKGVDGFDLLAYRYTGDPEQLAAEFVEKVPAPVCLAGSISNYQRLDKMKEIKPWTFTIGSAFFDNKFDGTFAEQIDKVINYIES